VLATKNPQISPLWGVLLSQSSFHLVVVIVVVVGGGGCGGGGCCRAFFLQLSIEFVCMQPDFLDKC